MRILFFSALEAVPFGGSEQLWTDMALRFLEEKHEVMACVLEWDVMPNKIKELSDHGAHICFRPNVHKHGRKQDWIINRLKETSWKKKVKKFVPDQIFINLSGTFDRSIFLHGVFLQSLLSPFCLLSNYCEEFGLLPERERLFFKDFFPRAKDFFFVSRRNLESAERLLFSKLTNAQIIKNPVKIKQTPASFPDSSECYKLAVVARLDMVVKGFDILIDTFSLPVWRQRNFIVNVYGSGAQEEQIRELISFRNMTDRIILKGFTDNVVSIWEENQLLLMPSRGEGTPLTLLEATYCSRAAVVTDVGDNAAVVQDGETGFVAKAPVISCFSEAMERAWQQRDHWQQLGINARKLLDETHPEDPVGEMCRKITF